MSNLKINRLGNYLASKETFFVNTLFAALLIAHLLPILHTKYFLTVDGPSHLYNAQIIANNLFSKTENVLNSFFGISFFPVPNLSGHLLLALLSTIMPGWLAEKMLLTIQILLLPLAWKYLIDSFARNAKYLYFFIFPFVYGFTFYYGFYNFNLGLILALVGLGYFRRVIATKFSKRDALIIGGLSLAIYFSHLLTLLFFYASLGAILLEFAPSERLLKRIRSLCLTLLPSMLITALYLYYAPSNLGSIGRDIDWKTLLEGLMQASPAKGVEYGSEGNFTRWIFILMLLLTIVTLVKNRLNLFKRTTAFLTLLPVSFLLIYFFAPDETAGGGLLSTRLLLLAFITWPLVFIPFKTIKWLSFLSVATLTYVSLGLLVFYDRNARQNTLYFEELKQANELISPNTVILPVVDRSYFLLRGIHYYLGVDKPVVLLENYEATLYYFPTYWHYAEISKINTDDVILAIPYELPGRPDKNEVKPDYLFYVGNQPNQAIVDENYQCVYAGTTLKLFKLQ